MKEYAWGLVERSGAQASEQVHMARSIQPSWCPIKLAPSRIGNILQKAQKNERK